MGFTQGYLRIIELVSVDGADVRVHVTINFVDGEVRSVDTSEIRCRADFGSNATFIGTVPLDPPWEESITQIAVQACQGEGNTLVLRFLLPITVNADGDATVEIVEGGEKRLG